MLSCACDRVTRDASDATAVWSGCWDAMGRVDAVLWRTKRSAFPLSFFFPRVQASALVVATGVHNPRLLAPN